VRQLRLQVDEASRKAEDEKRRADTLTARFDTAAQEVSLSVLVG
jgi:hypothetical protein